MKHSILCLLFLVYFLSAKAQNLIPNGDFEDYTSCPTSLHQIDTVPPWFSPSNATPDYLNSCTSYDQIDIPVNTYGFQYARSGEGIVGLVQFVPSMNPDYREYISVQLLSPLVANTCYKLDYYLNSCDRCQFNTPVSAYFVDTTYHYNTTDPIPVIPQFNNNGGNLADTMNWTLYSYTFTATGGENYLILGNFDNDQNIDTMTNTGGGLLPLSYIYVDDVSLSVCTSVEENELSSFSLYPNPVFDYIQIKFYNAAKKRELQVYDSMGREVFKTIENNQSVEIDLQSFASGLYHVLVIEPGGTYRKSFVKK